MKATVVWTQEAMNQLAQAWLSAIDRAAVTSAADAIDARLKQDPASAGVPYDDNSQLHNCSPCGGPLSVSANG